MEQAIQQSESIDDRLFVPLSRFLADDEINLDELEKLILKNGFNLHHALASQGKDAAVLLLRESVLEAYVKSALDRYAETDSSFRKIRQGFSRQPYVTLSSDSYGKVHVFDLSRKDIYQIGPLWELQGQQQQIPVIFSITSKKDAFLNVQHERELVRYLYRLHSYFCKIRPAAGNEDVRLYNQGGDYYRKILIPAKKFGRVAWALWNRTNNQNSNK
ncbi:hypothetical protein HYW20_00510 [Candidatus Woesearchaeota archaeon]|nr:hypothetical protein [Candidatus Woesearchaeota archaeon]